MNTTNVAFGEDKKIRSMIPVPTGSLCHKSSLHSNSSIPAPQLVCVELNPGPGNKPKKVAAPQNVKKKAKKSKGSLGRSILTGGGKLLGSIFGPSGSAIGNSAGHFFANVLGMGSYRIKSNVYSSSPDIVPIFNNTNDGSVVVEHRELVTDVIGSVAFANTGYVIDPINYSLFPYLSNVAMNFEQYEFLGLIFTYKPTSGAIVSSTNNALGTVILATEYDVSRANFVSKTEMDSYEFTTSCNPTMGMFHPVECNPKQDILNSRYISNPYRTNIATTTFQGTVATTVGLNLTQVGRLQMATVGMQAAAVVGELWVSYKIKLMKPRLPTNGTGRAGFYHLSQPTEQAVSTFAFPGLSTAVTTTNSTNPLSMIGINADQLTLNLTGVPPSTNIVAILSMVSGANTITFSNPNFVNVFNSGLQFVNNVGVGTLDVVYGNGTGKVCSIVSINTNASSYTAATNIGYVAPTVSGTTTFSWDLMVFVYPSYPNPTSTALLSSTFDQVSQMEALIAQFKLLSADKREAEPYVFADSETLVSVPSNTPCVNKAGVFRRLQFGV